jgi:putative sigma-54 modulation protein
LEITITGRHQPIDAPAREYLEEKLGRLARISERLTAVTAVVDQEHGRHVVELTVSAPPNHVFSAKAEGDDLRKAIDGADHKLEAQVRSWKDKLTDHRL